MSISQQLYDAINTARAEFVAMVNARGERFYDCPGNREKLITWLKTQNIPASEWISKHIFSAAFTACDSEGLLEQRPVVVNETPEAKQYRLDMEAKLANRPNHSRERKSFAEEVFDRSKTVKQKVLTEAEARKQAAEQARMKETADSDLSKVPTAAQIDVSGGLSDSEIRALSVPQIARYIQNCQAAELLKWNRRNNERKG